MFDYPPIINDEKKMNIGIRIPLKYRTLVGEIGNGNFSNGIYIILNTFEKKMITFLEKKRKKDAIIAKNPLPKIPKRIRKIKK